MSPSMKSKSKPSARAGKEQPKTSLKTSGFTNHESGIPASPYNPMLGAFQTLEASLVASSTRVHDNGHFPKTDDADEHSSSPQGTVSEYDAGSNNGSCSGESEDPKEKGTTSSTQPDVIPGCDNDRREKIRLKNERKHQRQRERRAQELHERCRGCLMSRKLEALDQQLVSMGFSSERAKLALMLNNGKLEESISWLFEGSVEESHKKDTSTTILGREGNLKIDISDELAQISALEVKYNCSKQEVERIIVSCEGDLQKAESTLNSQKQESPVTQSKSEDSAQNNSSIRSQGSPAASASTQHRANECNYNYYNVGNADSTFRDPELRNLHCIHLNHANIPSEKRWCASTTGSSPSIMSPFVKVETRHGAFTNEGRMIQQREPVVMMQHPQFTNSTQNSLASRNSLPSGTAGWYVNSIPAVENIRSNRKLLQTHNHLEQFCQVPYREHSSSAGVRGFCKTMVASSPPSATIPSQHQGSTSPSLTVPPSLGLFSGHQNPVRTLSSHSHVDWNNGSLMPEFDYTSIDWSLNSSASSKSGGLWLGISSLLRNSTGNNKMGMARETSSSSAGLREWTSPFAGKDIFSVPRQFVTSPPL